MHKVISKILAIRLKKILLKFITPDQYAFVKERLLMENSLLAREIMKDYHKDDISPICATKIDISKEVDLVQWEFFFLNTLSAKGFPPNYIHRIKLMHNSLFFGPSE